MQANDHSAIPMESRLQLQQTTVDCHVETQQLKVNIIKIDIEGAEAEVLEGSVRTLRLRGRSSCLKAGGIAAATV